MAMSAEEFLRLTPEQLLAASEVGRCTDCGCALQETITGNRRTSSGYVCSDCYFARMGDELDKRPIAVPCVHKGP